METSGNICIFELYNINGMKIMQSPIENGIMNRINLNDIPEGVYLYKIINDRNIVKTDKLVIIK
jgi:hypothetical protein